MYLSFSLFSPLKSINIIIITKTFSLSSIYLHHLFLCGVFQGRGSKGEPPMTLFQILCFFSELIFFLLSTVVTWIVKSMFLILLKCSLYA